MNAPYAPQPGSPVAPNQMPAVQSQQGMTAPPPAPRTHDVTVVSTKKLAQARVLGVPPEEFGIERGARDIRTCNYCFHDVVTKSKADLIDEGYDKEQVMSLEPYVGNTDIETISRDTVQEHFFAPDSADDASQLVKITEHYIRIDYEGTGRPCMHQVVTGGQRMTILLKDKKPAITKFDDVPFAAVTPVPIPHRFFGRSIADLVMDIQREKTALKRGALDNLYLHNNPRVEVAEANAGPNTLDDLLVSRPGGVVRTKSPGGLNWQVVPDITGSIYPMLEYLDQTREMRTGVTKQGQGVDANALQNQTATAVNQVFTMAQARMKLIARIIAETGVKDLFMLLHATVRKHGQQAQTVRLRNKWVAVDPRNWKTRNDLTINVGLGTGGKDQQFAKVMAIANSQKELLAGGKGHMVPDDKLFNTASELVKLSGYKNPDRFFADPMEKDQNCQLVNPPQPPPPDPKLQLEQAKTQSGIAIEQAKAQREAQNTQAAAQRDAQKAQLDLFQQKIKGENEIQMGREKLALEKEMALLDAALKERQDARAHEAHLLEMAHKREQHAQTIQGKQLDHKAKYAETYPDHATADQVNQTAAHVTALHGALAEHAKALEAAANAPVEIIRDPKTGRAAAIKRGSKTMTVHRGKDGRPEKLQ